MHPRIPHACVYAALALALALGDTGSARAEPSQLWGAAGERWTRESRLPDFSYAGYHRGDDALPTVEQTADVTRFGAVPNDNVDDTAAFRKAIEQTERGAIFIPAGRYVISDIVEIRKPGIVLRGAGADKTILYCPAVLEDVRPNMGATTTGDATSNYSWSGGFVWVQGRNRGERVADVTAPAERGARVIEIADAARITPGVALQIELRDDRDGSLVDYLYAGQPGNTSKLRGDRRNTSFVARVASADGNRVTLDRPLPFEIRLAWRPRVSSYEPRVTEVGIEHLGFEFPNRPYAGHFTERGANPIAISGAADCWVRDIRIHNADSGIFLGSDFSTVDGVVFTSERERDEVRHSTGHHGIEVGGDDNVIRNFDFRTRFIHDLTVSHCHGNVFADGQGEDLSLDHHKYAPYGNLFTNLDAGAGTQLWVCGGGADLGQHCAAWGTFWNIRAKKDLAWPRGGFCPDMVNLVGLTTDKPSELKEDGRWFEAIPPADLEPQNLYQSQRAARRAK